jgi:hypothetical protein
VVYFQVADLERPIRAAGLEVRQIGQNAWMRFGVV